MKKTTEKWAIGKVLKDQANFSTIGNFHFYDASAPRVKTVLGTGKCSMREALVRMQLCDDVQQFKHVDLHKQPMSKCDK